MVDLSIIIVNYNVKYFLRQCLQSIYETDDNVTKEIWVVDNASVDGSNEMVAKEFPEVQLIKNLENVGFSKANNQAIRRATGKNILLLNPDTLVPKECFAVCEAFIKNNPKTGGLGVKLLDGNGNFLPESKRGFPSPWAAFCKISGLGSIFKKSSFFNHYYLGHLDSEEEQSIEVLSGAFMYMPKATLDDIGLLDESFFMYGEDIDLSYRIKKGNYNVSYTPDTSIIHYKGESTKKSSINYVKHFYNAMLLFTEKHYGSQKKKGFLRFLKMGIYASAIIGGIKNLFGVQFKLIIDFILFLFAFLGISKLYALMVYQDGTFFSDVPLVYYVALFAFLWVFTLYIFGHYDKRSSFRKFTLGIGIGGLSVILIYSLFPESWRFSRAIVLLSIPLAALIAFLTKKIRNKISFNSWSFVPEMSKRILILGGIDSCQHVNHVVSQNISKAKVIGFINPEINTSNPDFLADISELQDVVEIHHPNELIFCSKEIEVEKIFYWMSKLGKQLTYKIANKDNSSILGSDSKNKMGNMYTMEVFYKIKDDTLMRLKRILDIFMSIIIFLISPLVLLFGNANLEIYNWVFKVLFNSRSWVGFHQSDQKLVELPQLKEGIFNTEQLGNKSDPDQEDIHLLNLYYAKSYAVWQDIELIWKNLFK